MMRASNTSTMAMVPWLLVLAVLTASPAASQKKEWFTAGVRVGPGGQRTSVTSTVDFPCPDKLLQLCEGDRYRQVATELIEAWRHGRSIWQGMLSEDSAKLAQADLPCVLSGLRSADPCTRWATMELVNAIGNPRSADAVLDFLKRENPRSQAASLGRFLLASLQDRRVVPFLLEALEHSGEWGDLATISRGPPDRRLCAPLLKALGSVPIPWESRGNALFRALAKNAPLCPQESEIERVVRQLSSAHWIEFPLVDLAQSLCPKTGCSWMPEALIEVYEHQGCPGDPRCLDKFEETVGAAGMMRVYDHFLRTGTKSCARRMADRILRQAVEGCERNDIDCCLKRLQTLSPEVRRRATSTALGGNAFLKLAMSPGRRLLDEYRRLFHGNPSVMGRLARWLASYRGPDSLDSEPAKLVTALNVALSERPRPKPDFERRALQRQLLKARWRFMNRQIPRFVTVKVLRTSARGEFVFRLQGPSHYLEAIRKAPADLLARMRNGRFTISEALVVEDPGTEPGKAAKALTIWSGVQESGAGSSWEPLRLIFLGSSPSAFRGSLPVP